MKEAKYIELNTELPEFLPYPKYLLRTELTQTARELYALLLNRATLSQRNRWKDEKGHVYLNFTIENCAKALGKCETTIKKAMKELDNIGLLERKAIGFGKPNRLYVKVFLEGQVAEPIADNILPFIGDENATSSGHDSVYHSGSKLTPNNTIYRNDTNKTNVVISGTKAYGRYQNINLTDQEYHHLKMDYPYALERYIDEMSCNIAAKGIVYKNYEAALRNWAARDKEWKKDKSGRKLDEIDYSFKEGESL